MLGLLRTFVLIVLMVPVTLSWAQDVRDKIVLNNDSDYPGFDLRAEKDVSLDQCKALCLKSVACAAFTYNVNAKFCFLKTDFGTLIPYSDAIAGKIVKAEEIKGPAKLDLGAAPELSFVAAKLINNARKFREQLTKGKAIETAPGFVVSRISGQQNLTKGDIPGAVKNFTRAVQSDPDNSDIWLELSRAAVRYKGGNRKLHRTYNNIGILSALNSYALSRTHVSRASALVIVARYLNRRGQYRNALTAYSKSLALNEVSSVSAEYAVIKEKHRFKVTGHNIDSQSKTPRVCVQFSEKLQNNATNGGSGAQLENFVRVNGAAPQAVEVSGKQLCAAGLEHGKTYNLTLRGGLPSQVEEVLKNDVTLTVHIRDRKPTMRFTNSDFVLPKGGQRGIPLISINATSAKLEIYRVGERALSQLLESDYFLKQMDTYAKDYLLGNVGQPVWKGSLDIKPRLNKEVVTNIPVDDVLKQRQPGVYLVSAVLDPAEAQNHHVHITQWFVVSDIGLTTFSGHGNEKSGGKSELRVFTRSLTTAKPLANIKVTLVARNNQVLGETTTSDQGEAVFGAGLMRGESGMVPKFISAKGDAGDFVLLDLSSAGFDFSDRGVTGRPVPKGVDVYAWTERGIYRAGETVHVSALARDPAAKAIKNLPLTFVFKRPDGVEDRRIVGSGESLGGYTATLPLTENAQHGTWSMRVFADTKAEPVAKIRFLVEDFLPERTEFTLEPKQKSIAVGEAVQVDVKGKYLYGTPAAGLELAGELVIRAQNTRKAFPGYNFGLTGESGSSTSRIPLTAPSPLNENGETVLNVALNETRSTTRPQTAELVVRMRETSGRAVERAVSLSVTPPTTMIGIKPQFKDGQIEQNSTAAFDVIAVDPQDNKTALSGAKWSLLKINRNYQWYQTGDRWRFETINSETQVADGVISIGSQTPTKITTPVEWGKYRLDIVAPTAGGPASSVEFNAGWYVESKSADTPDALEIGLDKPSYKAGETALLTVSPRFAGELLVAIGTDKIVETHMVTVPAEGKTIDLPVGKDWGAGAYVLATLYRPGNAQKSRMPMRAIGVKWLAVDPQDKALDVKLGTVAQSRPNAPFSVPVSISNLKAGEEAYVSIAMVDVGILNLTNYKSPDPVKRYLSQRKLGLGMRDIYGSLIDSSSGVAGKLRTGGDGGEAGMSTNGSAPTQKLLSLFSAPVLFDEDGKAEFTFDLPSFNGTARIMAVAWSANGIGSAVSESIIRDPIVLSATLPKFLATGDHSRFLLEVTNTDAPAGDYELSLESSSNLQLNRATVPATLSLGPQDRRVLSVPIIAQDTGTGSVLARLTNSDGVSFEKTISIAIRPDSMPVTRRLEVTLPANGGALKVDGELLTGSRLDGANINISVAQASAIDVDSLLLQLDRYPYGCAEQVTSKALPLLYASDFSDPSSRLNEAELKPRIEKAIRTVLAYQSNSGGFSLWGNSADDLWLSAYVADFLTRAGEKGFVVPAQGMKSALQNLQNTVAYQKDLVEKGEAVAYALYVLARNRKASAGDLRYFAEAKLNEFASPLARAHLAAGLALYGDQNRSESIFGSAYQLIWNKARVVPAHASASNAIYTYGSDLRDAAAILTLATESRAKNTDADGILKLVNQLRATDKYTSTQEQAWMLLAARAQQKANDDLSLVVNGQAHQGAYGQQITGHELSTDPVTVTNRNDKSVKAVVTAIAVPSEPLVSGGTGFTIKRSYYRLDGSNANVSEVRQNERFVVVVEAEQVRDIPSRIVITDLLPAGFEIDNPHLVDSAKNKNFSWLPSLSADHFEFRDDRFVAAYNHKAKESTKFTVAYTVRAVSPGLYAHPAAQVEDMYRPDQAARTAFGWMKVNAAQ